MGIKPKISVKAVIITGLNLKRVPFLIRLSPLECVLSGEVPTEPDDESVTEAGARVTEAGWVLTGTQR